MLLKKRIPQELKEKSYVILKEIIKVKSKAFKELLNNETVISWLEQEHDPTFRSIKKYSRKSLFTRIISNIARN